MTVAVACVQCALIAGFESSYTVDGLSDADTASDAGVRDGDVVSDSESSTDGSRPPTPTFGDASILASGEKSPFGGIAVDQDSVYWTLAAADAGVRAIRKDGDGGVHDLVTGLTGIPQEMVSIPNDTVYWRVTERFCVSFLCGPGASGSFGPCESRPRRLRTDGRRTYVLARDEVNYNYPIYVVPKGCAASMSASKRIDIDAGPAYVDIVPDPSGTRIYAVADGAIDCISVADATRVHVVDADWLDFAADDTHLYWLTPSELHRCTLGSATACAPCTDNEVVSTTQASSRPSLVLQGNQLYWVTDDGVWMVDKDAPANTSATALATGQAFPTALAVDATGVYWVNGGDGTVVHRPR
ncbi:hypothetical protein [Labilithrix luteola]|nr:hypothetical protein [Labilithrix luteola]